MAPKKITIIDVETERAIRQEEWLAEKAALEAELAKVDAAISQVMVEKQQLATQCAVAAACSEVDVQHTAEVDRDLAARMDRLKIDRKALHEASAHHVAELSTLAWEEVKLDADWMALEEHMAFVKDGAPQLVRELREQIAQMMPTLVAEKQAAEKRKHAEQTLASIHSERERRKAARRCATAAEEFVNTAPLLPPASLLVINGLSAPPPLLNATAADATTAGSSSSHDRVRFYQTQAALRFIVDVARRELGFHVTEWAPVACPAFLGVQPTSHGAADRRLDHALFAAAQHSALHQHGTAGSPSLLSKPLQCRMVLVVGSASRRGSLAALSESVADATTKAVTEGEQSAGRAVIRKHLDNLRVRIAVEQPLQDVLFHFSEASSSVHSSCSEPIYLERTIGELLNAVIMRAVAWQTCLLLEVHDDDDVRDEGDEHGTHWRLSLMASGSSPRSPLLWLCKSSPTSNASHAIASSSSVFDAVATAFTAASLGDDRRVGTASNPQPTATRVKPSSSAQYSDIKSPAAASPAALSPALLREVDGVVSPSSLPSTSSTATTTVTIAAMKRMLISHLSNPIIDFNETSVDGLNVSSPSEGKKSVPLNLFVTLSAAGPQSSWDPLAPEMRALMDRVERTKPIGLPMLTAAAGGATQQGQHFAAGKASAAPSQITTVANSPLVSDTPIGPAFDEPSSQSPLEAPTQHLSVAPTPTKWSSFRTRLPGRRADGSVYMDLNDMAAAAGTFRVAPHSELRLPVVIEASAKDFFLEYFGDIICESPSSVPSERRLEAAWRVVSSTLQRRWCDALDRITMAVDARAAARVASHGTSLSTVQQHEHKDDWRSVEDSWSPLVHQMARDVLRRSVNHLDFVVGSSSAPSLSHPPQQSPRHHSSSPITLSMAKLTCEADIVLSSSSSSSSGGQTAAHDQRDYSAAITVAVKQYFASRFSSEHYRHRVDVKLSLTPKGDTTPISFAVEGSVCVVLNALLVDDDGSGKSRGAMLLHTTASLLHLAKTIDISSQTVAGVPTEFSSTENPLSGDESIARVVLRFPRASDAPSRWQLQWPAQWVLPGPLSNLQLAAVHSGVRKLSYAPPTQLRLQVESLASVPVETVHTAMYVPSLERLDDARIFDRIVNWVSSASVPRALATSINQASTNSKSTAAVAFVVVSDALQCRLSPLAYRQLDGLAASWLPLGVDTVIVGPRSPRLALTEPTPQEDLPDTYLEDFHLKQGEAQRNFYARVLAHRAVRNGDLDDHIMKQIMALAPFPGSYLWSEHAQHTSSDAIVITEEGDSHETFLQHRNNDRPTAATLWSFSVMLATFPSSAHQGEQRSALPIDFHVIFFETVAKCLERARNDKGGNKHHGLGMTGRGKAMLRSSGSLPLASHLDAPLFLFDAVGMDDAVRSALNAAS